MREWALGIVAIGAALLAAGGAREAAAAGFPDVGAGSLLVPTSDGFDVAAPLATDVQIAVAGVVARVTVTQRFRNDGDATIEALYAFPLPDDAAVDRLTMRIGERLIEGEIRERQEAERAYGEARAQGRHASLVSQTTPNLFTTAVANLAPGEIVDVTIGYLQTARYDAGEFSLRFPMTFTPRYEFAMATDTAVREARLRVVVAPGFPLTEIGSRHHDVRVTRAGDEYVLETLAPRVPMDRDFVVAWRPEAQATPVVAALTETRGATTYALLMILPPTGANTYRAQPREVIYVIDTSGSMGGQSIEQAKAALADGLDRLTGADRFNVIQFNSTTSRLFPEPVPLTSASHAVARDYVARLDADGGTEMAPAIEAALGAPPLRGYLRQVIFLTDAGVGNETELFTLIRARLGDARLFTIGIGAAPNSYFMRKAAEFGRGTYTHIGDIAEVDVRMRALFDKLEHVALANVRVDWPDAVEIYPERAPDLYAGEPVLMAASAPSRGGPLAVTAYGQTGMGAWSQAVTAAPSELAGIAALWARRKIEHAIDSRVAGVDESVIRAVVLDAALEHGLVSPYTSLVAVDKTPAETAAALERRRLAGMTPAGAVTAGFPQTATAATLYRLVGALLLTLAAAALAVAKRTQLAGRPQ